MADSSAFCASSASKGDSLRLLAAGRLAQRVPERNGARVIEFPFCKLGQFALRKTLDGTRQAKTQRGFVEFARARGMAALAHHAGETQDIDRVVRLGLRGVRDSISAIEQRENFSGQRRQAAQVHLVVTENSHERFGRPSAQIIEIHLRNQRRIDVVVARPIERAAIAAQNMTFEILEAHRTKPQPPELARGMQQIQMQLGREWQGRPASCDSAFRAAASQNFFR